MIISVAKATLHSQMSIRSSVRHKTPQQLEIIILHHSSFIILHSSFIILHHPSFISRLLSFSTCFYFHDLHNLIHSLTIGTVLRINRMEFGSRFTQGHFQNLLITGWSAYFLSGVLTLFFYKVHPR